MSKKVCVKCKNSFYSGSLWALEYPTTQICRSCNMDSFKKLEKSFILKG